MSRETHKEAFKHIRKAAADAGRLDDDSPLEHWEKAHESMGAAHEHVGRHLSSERVARVVDDEFRAGGRGSHDGHI